MIGTDLMKRRLRAILAADIVGYSRLMEADEAGTIARQKALLNDLIKPMTAKHGGNIVKLMGDGILVEFDSAVDAVRYSVDIQTQMHATQSAVEHDQKIEYRVGINLGDVFYEDGDIFGDGVNIAARLEQAADPGGICISGAVHDLLKANLPVRYALQGELRVKNIQQSVRAYRVILEADDDWAIPAPPVSTRRRGRAALALLGAICALGIGGYVALGGMRMQTAPLVTDAVLARNLEPDRPSIAVLPFDNLGGDPEQDYFSDGMTEDLITDLSQVSGLLVLARNTVFTYKDKAVNVQTVGRQLDVDFVLEGSVRRAGDRVRINAQLISVETGGHVWANRYDRQLTDVFALQDEVVQRIVAAMAVALKTDEQERLSHSAKVDPEAYDLLLRGLQKLRRFSPDTNAEARVFFKKAIAIYPEFARAHADLALTHALDAEQQWTSDNLAAASKGLEAGLTALRLDPDQSQVHFVLSVVYRSLGDAEKSIASAMRSVELDPNYADGYTTLAISLTYGGRPEEAIQAIDKATRLNPMKPFFYVWAEGQANYLVGDFVRAAQLFEQVVDSNPHFSAAHKMLAATYVELGRIDDAHWAAQELLTTSPSFNLDVEYHNNPYSDPSVKTRYIESLRKAGLR
jgi:adenylate cyclase